MVRFLTSTGFRVAALILVWVLMMWHLLEGGAYLRSGAYYMKYGFLVILSRFLEVSMVFSWIIWSGFSFNCFIKYLSSCSSTFLGHSRQFPYFLIVKLTQEVLMFFLVADVFYWSFSINLHCVKYRNLS